MNRIKELREERRMSQVRLGIELEVTQETISAYEMGKHYPSAKSLIKMSDLFSASIDYILGQTDVRLQVNVGNLSSDETELLGLFHNLNHIQKSKAISYIQGMLED